MPEREKYNLPVMVNIQLNYMWLHRKMPGIKLQLQPLITIRIDNCVMSFKGNTYRVTLCHYSWIIYIMNDKGAKPTTT